MAAASPFALQSLHRFRCGSSCPWRGVCPQNIATVAITALCALSGAHVGVSRPRCRWQLYGWRHPTTPSREPHERSSYQSPCRHWPEGRFCRLSLPGSHSSAPDRRPDSDRHAPRHFCNTPRARSDPRPPARRPDVGKRPVSGSHAPRRLHAHKPRWTDRLQTYIVSGASAPPGLFSLTRGRSSRAGVRGFAIAGGRRRSSPACS